MKKKKKAELKKKNVETKKKKDWIYWTPRIVSIAFVLFLVLFSFDVFGQGYGFWGTILAFLMHNIPVIILLVVILIAWKYEIVGGIVFILGGVLYIARLLAVAFMNPPFQWYVITWSLEIAGPAFFIAILFFINWARKRKEKSKKNKNKK
jgi:hypothetical protein